jgi:hypothetical protein
MLFAFIILLEAAAVALTAIGCRFSCRRHRLAGWHLAFFGAVVAAMLAVFCTEGSYLLHPDRWSWLGEHSKESLRSVTFFFAWLTGLAILPALFVVHLYRKKYGDTSHVA